MYTKIQNTNDSQPISELWKASLYRSATMPDGTRIQECVSHWISISDKG